mmetsp:Transcript_108307/g.345905  ORF Transcript_108307/g.345905 Transcript_108307/m.345905 type:complete len:245 (-) Transcript_108307:112-846(-)
MMQKSSNNSRIKAVYAPLSECKNPPVQEAIQAAKVASRPQSFSSSFANVLEQVLVLREVLDLAVNRHDHGKQACELVPLRISRIFANLVRQGHIQAILGRLEEHSVVQDVHRDVFELCVRQPNFDQQVLTTVAGRVHLLQVEEGIGGSDPHPRHDLVPGRDAVVARLLLHDHAARGLELLRLPNSPLVLLLRLLLHRHPHVRRRHALLAARLRVAAPEGRRPVPLVLLLVPLDAQDLHEAGQPI